MAWLPTVRVVVENVATPPLSVFVPSTVAPSLNVTVPVGVPDKVAATEAVNFTELPDAAGLADVVSPVVVWDVIEKLADSVPSALPATSVLWKVTVLTPAEDTANGELYVKTRLRRQLDRRYWQCRFLAKGRSR